MGLTNEGGCGGTTTLLKNIMGLWLIQETRRWYNSTRCAGYSFADLESMARGAAPFQSFIDPAAPEFALPDDMPPKIQEYCRRTNQPVPKEPGEIMRCIYQSLACEFALTLREMTALTGLEYGRIHMIGGGTKDSLSAIESSPGSRNNVKPRRNGLRRGFLCAVLRLSCTPAPDL